MAYVCHSCGEEHAGLPDIAADQPDHWWSIPEDERARRIQLTEDIGPFFGWLSTEVGYYEESTINLKTMVHFIGGGKRPVVELEPIEHPLAIDQRNGITLEKAWEIVHYYMVSQAPS